MRTRGAAKRVLAAALTAGISLAWLGSVGASPAAAASCVTVNIASSPEKLVLLTDLGKRFKDSGASVNGKCITVNVAKVSSGAGEKLLETGWPSPASNGPRPVIWSPAANTWGAVLNQRRAVAGKSTYVPTPGVSFMQTPVVIAMPKPMAQALGWPNTPIGFSDILALARDPNGGWASKGHPEFGPFRFGKTNPNFSTSGLAETVAQYYAGTGKTRDLTLEDLTNPTVAAFSAGVESAVVHYGDTTLTFLNNLYHADQRGNPYGYASAVAVEEKSVLDYNSGNPDGILDPGEKPRKPRIPLVAIYPKEGTFFDDDPLIVLDAPWVSNAQKAAAKKFTAFVTQPKNQRQVLKFGFRPGNPAVAIGAPIIARNGVDPKQPQTTLEVPKPPVLAGAIDEWNKNRKRARVLLVIDVSGSMGDEADPRTGATKLDLAKRAARAALNQFLPDDEVGLRIFSTGIANNEPTDYKDLVPIAAISSNRGAIESAISSLVPTQGTPLYTVAHDSYQKMSSEFDPTRINAVVLLTDGRNEDDRNNDLPALLRFLRAKNEGESAQPVRIFPIAYGSDADEATLKRIAEATSAAEYSAIDPATIVNVFNAVVSNF